MRGMDSYTQAAVERAMKVQEVMLQAMAKSITWWQAAEIIGITDRHMRHWHWWYREFGYDGLRDRRLGKPSPKRVPLVLGRAGVHPISGAVFRSQREASPREASRGASDSVELYVVKK